MMNSRTMDRASESSKKRRFSRVSRACTECRVRKIRCDGRQRCQPCEDFDRHCSYMSTKAQKTGGAPRTKILEDRLRRARKFISQIQSQHPSLRSQAEVDAIFESPPGSPSEPPETPQPASEDERDTPDLEHMLDAQGHLIFKDGRRTEYYGGPSGFTFLKFIQQFFGQDTASDSASAMYDPRDKTLLQLFDSPLPGEELLGTNLSVTQLLPSRRNATRLLHVVFNQTYPLFLFLHEATFNAQMNRIYELDQLEFNDTDHGFIPLFLAVIAIGYLFDQKLHHDFGCSRAIDEATRRFLAARQMFNLHNCHDLTGIQTNIYLTLFLISTARITSARAYVGLAVSSAFRMGLHAQTSTQPFSDLELDLRRRVFWTIVKLDIYIATILGLPTFTNLDHVDQSRLCGNVKEYQPEMSGLQEPNSTNLFLAASAQYLNLLLIMGKTVHKLYPTTKDDGKTNRKVASMTISTTTISEMEGEYETWRDGLPSALDVANQPQTSALTSVTYELEMAHNFGHILLYCPFLHYLAQTNGDDPPDKHQLGCATSCIKIARVSIQRSEHILRQGSLAAAAWQSIYTVFLSVVVLFFFLATQQGAPDYDTVRTETEKGIHILAATSCQDIGSRRCLDFLKILLKQFSKAINIDIEGLEQKTPILCHRKPSIDRGADQTMNQTMTNHQIRTNQQQNARSWQPSRSNSTVSNSNQFPNHIITAAGIQLESQRHNSWSAQPLSSLSDLQTVLEQNDGMVMQQHEIFLPASHNMPSDNDLQMHTLFNETFGWQVDPNMQGIQGPRQPEMVDVDPFSQEPISGQFVYR